MLPLLQQRPLASLLTKSEVHKGAVQEGVELPSFLHQHPEKEYLVQASPATVKATLTLPQHFLGLWHTERCID